MIDHRHYTYRVIWSEEDAEYVALCAEFPSLSCLSEDNVGAYTDILQLVGEVLNDMESEGEVIPTPISSKTYSGKFQVRVPPEQHKHLAMEAAEQGVSLNRYISSKL